MWFILPMMVVNYMPAAGLRGLWIGPYYTDVFGADAAGIGRVTLIMGLAMVLGNFVYGPLDRVFKTRKWLIVVGNLLACSCLLALFQWPALGGWRTMALLAGVGFFGASFAMVIAHGRAFFPPHLMGRGVTLLNLFGIAPIGIAQIVTGRIHAAPDARPDYHQFCARLHALCRTVPVLCALIMLLGILIYAFAPDRTD